MPLPPCRRCGTIDPERMVGLMTLWFGSLAGVEPAHGYFHLCPRCFAECVEPNLEELADALARMDPEAAAYMKRERERDVR